MIRIIKRFFIKPSPGKIIAFTLINIFIIGSFAIITRKPPQKRKKSLKSGKVLLPIYASYSDDIKDFLKRRGINDIPDMVIEGFLHRISDKNGNIKWIIKSKRASFIKRQNVLLLDSFELYMIDKKTKRVSSRLKARFGLIDQTTMDMVAMGHVVGIGKTNTRVESERIFWDNKRQLLYNNPDDRVVVYTKEGNVFTGKGFTADKNIEFVRVKEFEGKIKQKVREVL